MTRKIIWSTLFLLMSCVIVGTVYARGTMITSELWIRAVIRTAEKGEVEAVWQKGGQDTNAAGDRVIWGYFHADPDEISWGSQQNPDVFVKIWFDRSGRLDVNYLHVSVPDIDVYSAYPYNGTPDEHATATLAKRYVRQYYENGQSHVNENYEDGSPSPDAWYWTENMPEAYHTEAGVSIAAMIDTWEKGPVHAVWHKGGDATTPEGHQVIWGYFYASPEDVSWGSENNPDLFVKIWFDTNGRIDVNFFHVSVPLIEVCSDLSDDDVFIRTDPAIMDNRYVRHEYQTSRDCSREDQNRFVHEVMTDSYLWYDKVPSDVDHAAYPSPEELLDDLKYEELDRWSYVTSTEDHYAYFEDGKYVGIGLSFKLDNHDDCRIAFVHRNSPADTAGLKRSDRILEINGKSPSELYLSDLWDTVLGPDDPGVTVRLKVEDSEGIAREFDLEKDWIAIDAILHYDILESNGPKIGYLVFNTFIESAKEELDMIFAHFKQEEIDELILDLRYNRGGKASVAQYLASLVAGDIAQGKIFAKYLHNDKYDAWNSTDYFTKTETPIGLERVVFICTDLTCSASELVMNSLDPFIEVVSVGNTTCGKPVGMHGQDFCDIHIAPIEFRTVNAYDEGDYFDGISPTCPAGDDLSREFGDIEEASLTTALHYIADGSCHDESSKASKSKENRMISEKIGLRNFRKDIRAF